jgi:uncharacterized membrane protein
MMNDHSWGWGMGGNYWITPLVAILVVAVIILAVYLIKNRLKK